MSRPFVFVACLVVALLFAFAPAASADVTFRVDGIGSRQCSVITAAFQKEPTAVANDMMGWAYGYMTRRNYERARAGLTQIRLQSEKFGPADMVALMLTFCEQNPDVHYYMAVDALFEILAREQGLVA
jgi:hypothetical protein